MAFELLNTAIEKLSDKITKNFDEDIKNSILDLSKKYKFKFGKTLNISKLYIKYQERLKILNSADFGDLLLLPVKIFR